MAAIDFPASPIVNQLFVAGNGVTYMWTGTLWLAQAVAGVAVSDTPPGSPATNQLWFNSLLGQMFVYYNDGNTTQWVPASPNAGGDVVVQTVFTETGAVATGTTLMPFDDTIPQITEGNEYMTVAITPKSTTSKLIIGVVWNGTTTVAGSVIVALFQGATAGALAAITQAVGTPGNMMNMRLTHVMTSGTTSATTFRVRAGGNAAGTTTFNGTASARIFGGVMASSIIIQEVL